MIEKRNNHELTELLGLEGTLDRMRKTNGVQWYGHVLRRYGNDVLREELNFESIERRRGGPNDMREIQVGKHIEIIGLKKLPPIEQSGAMLYMSFLHT